MRKTKDGLYVVSGDTIVSTLVSLGLRPPANISQDFKERLEERFKKMYDENPELGEFTSKLAESLGETELDKSLNELEIISNMFKLGVVLTYESLRRQGESYRLSKEC